jgi:hypothetical protein
LTRLHRAQYQLKLNLILIKYKMNSFANKNSEQIKKLLIKYVPKDLVNIVCEYNVSFFLRPFKKKHCLICGDCSKQSFVNLCNNHINLCPLCLKPTYYYHRCYDCSQISWISSGVLPKYIMEVLYENADSLNANELKQRAINITNEIKEIEKECINAKKEYDEVKENMIKKLGPHAYIYSSILAESFSKYKELLEKLDRYQHCEKLFDLYV